MWVTASACTWSGGGRRAPKTRSVAKAFQSGTSLAGCVPLTLMGSFPSAAWPPEAEQLRPASAPAATITHDAPTAALAAIQSRWGRCALCMVSWLLGHVVEGTNRPRPVRRRVLDGLEAVG